MSHPYRDLNAEADTARKLFVEAPEHFVIRYGQAVYDRWAAQERQFQAVHHAMQEAHANPEE